MVMPMRSKLYGLFWLLLFLPISVQADPVLAQVGSLTVTGQDLEEALASSPVASAFPSLDADAQAALRGDLLQRLVAARLLEQEAQRLGLDRTETYRRERAALELGLRYRAYMDQLRASLRIPESEETRIRRELAEKPETWEAARSAYLSQVYETRKAQMLEDLKKRYKLVIYGNRLNTEGSPDSLLAEGEGIQIRRKDLEGQDPAEIERRLQAQVELQLVARAAEVEGIDIGAKLARYDRERLPDLLLEQKAAEWIPDEQTLRNYYKAHPELGQVPEFRQIGQLVVASRKEAEALRARILAGESLYALAGQYSIDPYGKKHLGDLGWLPAGSGMPAIEAAIAELPEGQVSPVIETPKGFHLVVVRARRSGMQKPFSAVRDRVRQALIAERLPAYLASLAKRFPIVWKLPIEQGTAP